MSFPTRLVLFLAALTMIGIGATIALAPHVLYSQPDGSMPGDIVLASDLRSSGSFLLVCGLIVLSAGFGLIARRAALSLAAIAFLSYGLGRVLSFVMDGIPNATILTAAGVEWVLGLATLATLWVTRPSAAGRAL